MCREGTGHFGTQGKHVIWDTIIYLPNVPRVPTYRPVLKEVVGTGRPVKEGSVWGTEEGKGREEWRITLLDSLGAT